MAVEPRARPGRPDPDLALVLKHQAGETDAFGWLWLKYEPRLRRYFLRATRSDTDADDLASETILAALRAMPRFTVDGPQSVERSRAAFGTFLHAIARNQLSLWYRHRRCHPEIPIDDAWPGADDEIGSAGADPHTGAAGPLAEDPGELLMAGERRNALCCALASVESDSQFSAVLLHYVAGWTHHDVGQFLGAKSASINTRLQDGRKSLRRGYDRLDAASI